MSERIWDQFLPEEDKEVFNAAGYGARGGFGERPAVLVIDVSYGFTGEKDEPVLESIKTWPNSCGQYAWRAIPHLQRLVNAARAKGLPVIYTTGEFRDDGWDAGGWAWKNSRTEEDTAPPSGFNRDGNDIMDEIAPGPKDIVIRKLQPSVFNGTPLMGHINDLGADSLIVTGTTTSGCVRATVIDAFSLNLRVTIAEEGCFDRSEASHAINLCDMNAKYADVIGADEVLEHINGLDDLDYNLPSGTPGSA